MAEAVFVGHDWVVWGAFAFFVLGDCRTRPFYAADVIEPETLEWLVDSDPALRWQVERDLAGEPEPMWRGTRSRVATEGFGARLLALQDPDGQWAAGAYFPGDFDFAAAEAAQEPGQPWTATTWSLNSLRELTTSARLPSSTAVSPILAWRTQSS